MSKLYVVNATGQNRQIYYRLDFTVDDQGRRTDTRLVPPKMITIPARQQMQFGGELHPQELHEIIQQLEATCGAVSTEEIRTAKARGVVKLVWSQDRPVPRPILEDVVNHNVGILSDQGAERRRSLAVAADAGLTQLVERPLPKLEMEFEQVEEDADLPGMLKEGLRIRHPEIDRPTPKRGRPRKVA